MTGESSPVKGTISSLDCMNICSVLALSLSVRDMKKISNKYNLVPDRKKFDPWYTFYLLHQHAHIEKGIVSDALTSILNRRHAGCASRIRDVDSGDSEALNSFLEKEFAKSPGGLLWSLLTDSRQDFRSRGVHLAHRTVYRLLHASVSSVASPEEKEDESQTMDTILRNLETKNAAMKSTHQKLAAKLDNAEKMMRRLEAERDRLAKRVNELESLPSREGRLLREIRMLRYQLKLSPCDGSVDAVSESHIFPCDRVFPSLAESSPPLVTGEECAHSGSCPLKALKVAVVGGLGRLESRYRDTVERLGGEFLFHDGYCHGGVHVLRNMVCCSDIVVFITSVNSHIAMWVVKAECKKLGKKFTVVKRTSPDALEHALLAEAAG